MLSILLTPCLTAIKNYVVKYCTTIYERNGKHLFWSIKNSGEIINKLKSRGFLASCLSTYDFSNLYTTLPTGVYLLDFFCSGIQFNLLLSPYPCFISLLYLDLYVLGDDALIS